MVPGVPVVVPDRKAGALEEADPVGLGGEVGRADADDQPDEGADSGQQARLGVGAPEEGADELGERAVTARSP